MTTISSVHPPKSDVFGAYSLWPRRPRTVRRRLAISVAAFAVAGLFFHCVLPMALGA